MKFYQLALLILIPAMGFTQKDKIKFGKVPLSEIRMDSYEADPTANAVILFDLGKFNGGNFEFTRHVRLKILTKEGTKWGNWVLRTPNQGYFDAFVFNEQNGVITKEKLQRSSIHEEEIIDGVTVYKLFMPNVVEGSVIDLKYRFVGLPYEWRFQDLIPVAYSELLVGRTDFIKFDKRGFGFHPLETIGNNHWIARNVPAFGIEPYLSHYSNYITKIQFEISKIDIPGLYREFSTSWEQVNENLLKYQRFGGVLRSSNFLNKEAQVIQEMDVPDKEKALLCF